MNLPKEIWQIIFDKSCFISKIHMKICCRLFYQILEINDFYNIDEYYLMKLTDDIISNYNITMLNADNSKITNEGIKHMQLHTLYASYNSKITDEGIKHMQLHTLDASDNPKITDEGIKHMQLHTLDASYNSNITDEGIKHMQLHTLYASVIQK